MQLRSFAQSTLPSKKKPQILQYELQREVSKTQGEVDLLHSQQGRATLGYIATVVFDLSLGSDSCPPPDDGLKVLYANVVVAVSTLVGEKGGGAVQVVVLSPILPISSSFSPFFLLPISAADSCRDFDVLSATSQEGLC